LNIFFSIDNSDSGPRHIDITVIFPTNHGLLVMSRKWSLWVLKCIPVSRWNVWSSPGLLGCIYAVWFKETSDIGNHCGTSRMTEPNFHLLTDLYRILLLLPNILHLVRFHLSILVFPRHTMPLNSCHLSEICSFS